MTCMDLEVGASRLSPETPPEWRHGVIRFGTGMKSKYLIIPPSADDPMEIVQVMLQVWKLSLPKLLIAIDGGQHPAPAWWSNVMHQEVWQPGGSEMFNHAMTDIFTSVVEAAVEIGAWFWTFQDKVYEGKNTMCGQARQKVDGGESVAQFTIQVLSDQYLGAESIETHAVPIDQDPEFSVEYPSVTKMFVDGAGEVTAAPDGCGFDKNHVLAGYSSHLLFVRPDSRLASRWDVLHKGLCRALPTAMMIVSGSPQWLYPDPVVFSNRMPVILLNNSGGTADILSEAVSKFRQDSEDKRVVHKFPDNIEVEFELPRGTRHDQFIIVDAMLDKTQAVVDKVLNCISLMDDVESRQIGFRDNETARLVKAWELFIKYDSNAKSHLRFGRLLQYTISTVSFGTTLASVVYEEALSNKWEWVAMDVDILGHSVSVFTILKWGIASLPLLSGFLLACNSRFSPRTKHMQLAVAASRIKTEVYEYRARVFEYRPRKQDGCHGLFGANDQQDAASASGTDTTMMSLSEDGNGSNSKTGKGKKKVQEYDVSTSRSAKFGAAVEQIHTALMQGDMGRSSLEPASLTFEDYRKDKLMNSSLPDRRSENQPLLQAMATEVLADDGISTLNTENYIACRLMPARAEFERESSRISFWLALWQIVVYVCTAANAILALAEKSNWMPIVVGFNALILSSMEYENYNGRLTLLNSALTTLEQVLFRWEAMSFTERKLASSKEFVVETTELAINIESAWARASKRDKKAADSEEDKDATEEK